MMGRGSDTRMYSPRSESSHMYGSANEDGGKYSPTSPEDADKRREEKQRKDEERKARLKDIKHIKIKPSQGLGSGPKLPTEEGLDDGNKRDDEREISLQGGPAGSRGHLLDLATGAKTGTGSAMGTGNSAVRTGEPMEDAWSTLLKEDDEYNFTVNDVINTPRHTWYSQIMGRDTPMVDTLVDSGIMPALGYDNHHHGDPAIISDFHEGDVSVDESLENIMNHRNSLMVLDAKMQGKEDTIPQEFHGYHNNFNFTTMMENEGIPPHIQAAQHLAFLYSHLNYLGHKIGPQMGEADDDFNMKYASEPMNDAWSTLLKEEDDVPDMSNFKNPGTQSDMYMDDFMEHVFDQGWPLIPYTELSEKQKMIIDMMQSAPPSYFTDPASGSPQDGGSYETDSYQNLFSPDRHHLYSDEDYDEYARYLKHYFDASAAIEDLPHEVKMQVMKNIFYAHDMKQKDPNFDLTPYKDDFQHPLHPDTVARKKMAEEFEHWNVDDPHTENYYRYKPSSFDRANFNESTGFTMSEPMDDVWSELLKRETPKTIQARRRREGRQNFRPSTGQFKKPPGGQSGGAGATMRRFKARMRGIKGSKRTGLMKPHLSVEMSHRGIATKQPMSKDPQKYRQYMGQQEAQKILGGVRNTFSPHARHSARSFVAGPTGGGRLTGMLPGQAGQMRQPSLSRLSRPRRPRMPRMPRMPRPPMAPQMPMMPPAPPAPIMTSEDTPSQIMMSSDRTESDILKANRHARKLEMLELMRRLIDLQKKRNKLMKYVQGGGSAFENGHVPTHPAGVQQHEDEDEKNDGPTQNLETNSSRLGLDPAGHLSGKRGHFG